MLNLDTFVDLENNIPFMYSDVNSEYDENDDFQMKKGTVSNIKKIFRDSTRFISPYERHHLVYSNT